MLLVGVYKFGYGSWVQIRDDPLLGLQNKLFLENPAAGKDATANQDGKESVKKVPGSVHLGRRVDYLFTLLRDEESDSSVGGSTPVGSVRKRIRKSTPVPHNSGSSNGSHNTLW